MKDTYIEMVRKEIELIGTVLTYARLGLKNAQMHNCNDCTKKDCEFKPDWGDDVRINCPLWEGEEDEDQ